MENFKLVFANTKKLKKQFILFKRELYLGDKNYVSTAEFVLEDILYNKTKFAKSCKIYPFFIYQNNTLVLEACIILHSQADFLQLGFFEAKENCQEAVDYMLNAVKKFAVDKGVKKIVIGINGHLSYGVGILVDGFNFKNSFDSEYNKQYYKEYFCKLKKEKLVTFYEKLENLDDNRLKMPNDIIIRHCDLKNYYAEMELMRELCEKTIAKTFLYFPTQKGHFYELTKDLKIFLKPENLFFAQDRSGNYTGFIFWHPDFNQMIKGGKTNSLLQIFFGYLFKGKKINVAKLNAIGSLNYKSTIALLYHLNTLIRGKYDYLETTFVWENNVKSYTLNKKFFKKEHRRYEVYLIDEFS